MITAGSGLGAFACWARNEEYGSTFKVTGSPKGRYFKTWKPTHDPHIVQGGPYLAGGRIVDIGSAHVKMYTDAKAVLTGDVMTTEQALLLGAAFGNDVSLKQVGTTAAREVFHTPPGGSQEAGLVLEAIEAHEKEKKSCWLDFQVGIPYTNAEITPYSYKSGAVTKAEFVFDRTALVSYTYDIDFRTVNTAETLVTPVYTTNGVPFAMTEAGSSFKIGNPGSMSTLAAVKKMTVTLERKLATNRIYLGEKEKSFPITNALVDITVSVEADFTEAAKNVFAAFLNNEALEIEAIAEGAEIGTSGKKNKFQFKLPNVFINAGAEPPIEGPEIIHNTMTAKATINAANNPAVSAELITGDTAL